jgi:hypothetical protein
MRVVRGRLDVVGVGIGGEGVNVGVSRARRP